MGLLEQKEVLQSVIQRALEDISFKKNLIKKPTETIEKFIGQSINLPKGKHIVVHDQSDPAAIYITIPTETDTEDIELTEEQLEAVAGGVIPPIISDDSN